MANYNPDVVEASGAYNGNENFYSFAEHEDVSAALAASLDYAQATSSQVHGHANWTPRTAIDWKSFRRQNAAYSEAVKLQKDPDLQIAINESMAESEKLKRDCDYMDVSAKSGTHAEGGISSGEARVEEEECRSRPTLETRIQDLYLDLALELPLLHDPDGDTYIYIDPPAQQPEQDDTAYERYTERYRLPILMKKATLSAFDSAFFEKLFGSTYQHRIIRRRGLVNKLPTRVKYVLDLTPPSEGEEAVYLTTELCCSENVRRWYQSCQRWRVSKSLVGGQEEYVLPSKYTNRDQRHCALAQNTAKGDQTMSVLDHEITKREESYLETQLPLPLEYSPVRHRSAIERVLAAVHGLEPHLDSAPKVWTTFAVARYFGITHSLLTDYIVRWLRACPNTYFIEVLPEVTLQIADGLQCYDLYRDAFAILVGEEAIGNVNSLQRTPIQNSSVYGRKRSELPESLQTCVEYASKSFMERVMLEFTGLVDDEMSWIESLPQYRNLYPSEHTTPLERDALISLQKLLKDYVKGTIYKILYTDYALMPNAIQGFAGGDDLFPRTSWADIWTTLVPKQRILTRSFWTALAEFRLFSGETNFHVSNGLERFSQRLSGDYSTEENNFPVNAKLREVSNEDITYLIEKIDALTALNVKYENSFRVLQEEILDVYLSSLRPSASVGAKCLPIRGGKHEVLEAEMFRGEDQSKRNCKLAGNKTINRDHPDDQLSTSTVFEHCKGLENGFGFEKEGVPRFSAVKRTARTILDDVVSDDTSYVAFLAGESARNQLSKTSKSSTSENDCFISLRDIKEEGASSPVSLEMSKNRPFFRLNEFFIQATQYLNSKGQIMIAPTDAYVREQTVELGLTPTLVCLTDSEWKFLPLWAGGNDDGSGGVFDDEIPISYDGFSTAGPKINTSSARSIASTDSSYTVVSSVADSTNHNASVVVNDGYPDTWNKEVAAFEENDLQWDHISFKKNGSDIQGDNSAARTMQSASSVTFDSDDFAGPDTAVEDEDEEERAQKMVDSMEAVERTAARREEGMRAFIHQEDHSHFIDNFFNDGDDDDLEDDEVDYDTETEMIDGNEDEKTTEACEENDDMVLI